MKAENLTPFENSIIELNNGNLQTPKVYTNGKQINYPMYMILVHHFNLKIFASGMTMRGMNLKTLKNYYGLKKRSAKECLIEFEQLMLFYGIDLKTNKN